MGEFGRRLKAVRQKTGMSQAELASKAGVEKAAVGRWETTDMIPSESNMDKLAKALGIDKKSLKHPPIEELTPEQLESLKTRIKNLSPYRQLLVSQIVRELGS